MSIDPAPDERVALASAWRLQRTGNFVAAFGGTSFQPSSLPATTQCCALSRDERVFTQSVRISQQQADLVEWRVPAEVLGRAGKPWPILGKAGPEDRCRVAS